MTGIIQKLAAIDLVTESIINLESLETGMSCNSTRKHNIFGTFILIICESHICSSFIYCSKQKMNKGGTGLLPLGQPNEEQ